MKYVMMPGMARKRHLVVEAREQRMEDEAASLGLNRVEMRDTALGVVVRGCGAINMYARRMPEASILKLGIESIPWIAPPCVILPPGWTNWW